MDVETYNSLGKHEIWSTHDGENAESGDLPDCDSIHSGRRFPTGGRKCAPIFILVGMETLCPTNILVHTYQTPQCHNPEVVKNRHQVYEILISFSTANSAILWQQNSDLGFNINILFLQWTLAVSCRLCICMCMYNSRCLKVGN